MRNVRFEHAPAHRNRHAFLIERGVADRTYEEVARALRISVARVGQIERAAFARMRHCFELIESGVAVDEAVERSKGRIGRPRKVLR